MEYVEKSPPMSFPKISPPMKIGSPMNIGDKPSDEHSGDRPSDESPSDELFGGTPASPPPTDMAVDEALRTLLAVTECTCVCDVAENDGVHQEWCMAPYRGDVLVLARLASWVWDDDL